MSDIEFQLNGKKLKKNIPLSLQDLVEELNLQRKKIAIEVDGEIIPKSLHDSTQVQAGAKIEIVHAVGGG
jgi:sulfur carrier protein